jgi:hypothetical protein
MKRLQSAKINNELNNKTAYGFNNKQRRPRSIMNCNRNCNNNDNLGQLRFLQKSTQSDNVTENPIIPHNNNVINTNNNKENVHHLNEQFIRDLNQEINLFKTLPKFAKPFYNQFNKYNVIPKLYTNNNHRNVNNKFTYDDLIKVSNCYKKDSFASMFPESVEHKKQQMKRMPFIIKCMDKKKKLTLYKQTPVDPVYSHKYRKASVNIEDILLNHNMNERCGMMSKKVNGCLYFRGIYFRELGKEEEQKDKKSKKDNKKKNDFFITYNVYSNGNNSCNQNECATSSKGFTSDYHSANVELVLEKNGI